MDFYETISLAGVDAKKTLKRFSDNEVLWKRFLKKFPEDQTFEKLAKAMQSGDLGAVESEAHTLKGASANLGFDRLSEYCAELVGCVRAGMAPQQQYDAVAREYANVCGVLQKCGL